MSGRDVVKAMRARGELGRGAGRGRSVDLALAAVAVCALGICACFALGWTGRAPVQSGKPVPATLLVSSASVEPWGEADEQRCLAAARRATRSPDADIADAAQRGIPSITEGGYAGLATNVRCLATTKTSRLCDPAEKAAFVETVNDYVARYDIMVLALGAQNGFVSMAGSLVGGEAEMGAQFMDDLTAATVDYIKHYHYRVRDSLRQLARDGLLASGDFGVFGMGASGTIVSMLAEIDPTRAGCAGR